MLEQRRDQFSTPMMMLIVILVLLAFFVIWTISSQISLTQVAQTTTTVQTAPVVKAVDIVETANTIKFNQQASGLASNWNAFQASLNYADYPSQIVAQREMTKLVNSWDSSSASLPTNYQGQILAQQGITEFGRNVPLVSLTAGLDYNLPTQQEFGRNIPLVSLTAGLDYNLPK